MESVRVERLDHLGVIASVIKDLGLIDMIDARLVPDEQESDHAGRSRGRDDPQWLGVCQSALVLDATVFCQQTPRSVVS